MAYRVRNMKDSYTKIFEAKQRVLVVLAHPDDAEIICGGVMARLVSDGKKVRAVVTTDGQRGMHDNTDYSNEEFAKIRMHSQKKAGIELGLDEKDIYNLQIPDGQVENTFENIGKIAFHIREFRPDIIITHRPNEMINWFSKELGWVNHRDHRMTAEITLDAAYPYANDNGFYRDQIELGLKGHSVSEFLFSDSYMHDDAIGIDVSDFLGQKRKALEHHMDGGVLSAEEIDGFMQEVQRDGGNYEVLGYVKLE